MKRIIVSFVVSVSISIMGFSQGIQNFGFICCSDAQQEQKSNEDVQYRPYIPYEYMEYIPVHVNMVFLQKDDGKGGFKSTDSEHQRLFDEVEDKVNEMYASLVDSDTAACFQWKDKFLSTAKVHFLFKRVYIKDSYAWNRNNYITNDQDQCPPLPYINYLQQRIENDASIPLGVNIFFTEDSALYELYASYGANMPPESYRGANSACSALPSQAYSQIHMRDIYCKYLWMKYCEPKIDNVSWIPTVWGWMVNGLANTLAHELGHSLNLNHGCNHYTTNGCPHALMHQANIDPQHLHNYIPPTEIGKMHKALMNTRLRNFVDKNLLSVGLMTITQDLNWNGSFRCYADLNIATSGRLTMQGQVQMPQKSTIETSGHLYIRNGNIACANANESWQGIRVKQGGLLWLENTTVKDFDIIMETGSTLVLSGNIRFENGHKVILSNGVYVCAESNLAVSSTVLKPFYTEGPTSSAIISGISDEVDPWYPISCSSQGNVVFIQNCTEIPETLYIQKEQINQDMTYVGKTILVGNSVDPNSSRPKGDVVVNAPARVKFVYKNRLVLDKGFRCNSGGSYRGLRF